MKQLKYIIKYLISLITNPEQTWNYLADEDVDEANPEYVQTNFYLPMLGVVSVFVFVINGWGSPFNLEHAMKSAIPFIVAYFASQYLSEFLMQKTYQKFKGSEFDKDRLNVLVLYGLSYLMLVALFTTLFPQIKFLSFCSIYLVYIVWASADKFMNIPLKDKVKFTAISFFIIWMSPAIIERLMSMMER